VWVPGAGKAEAEMSKPVSLEVGGKVRARSRRKMPVPVSMSAIL